MRFTFLLLVVFFGGCPVLATTFEVGNQVCDKDKVLSTFMESSELLSSREEMAKCVLIEGLSNNLPWMVDQGLSELVRLSENESRISASYFLVQYYWTDGTFFENSNRLLEQSENYLLLTLSQIEDLGPDYSGIAEDDMEKIKRIKLSSYYRLLRLFLTKYDLGVKGAHSQRQLASPDYQGSRDLETDSKYSQHDIVEYLNKVLLHASSCISLSENLHYEQFPHYLQACQLIHETAEALKELEPQRYSSLQECSSLTDKTSSCPVYFKVLNKIEGLQDMLQEELKRVLEMPANQKKDIDVVSCVSHVFKIETRLSATESRGTFTNNCGEDVLIRWQSNGEEKLYDLDGDSCNMRTDYDRLLVKSESTGEYLVQLPLNCNFEIEWCGELKNGEGNCYVSK